MDVRRLEASGDLVGLLRELLRRGLKDEARALALKLIRGGASWSVVDNEDDAGVAWPVYNPHEENWVESWKDLDRWVVVSGSKVPALWTPQREQLFACDVAESVLPHFEAVYLGAGGPRALLVLARRYAYGLVSEEAFATARRKAWNTVSAANHRAALAREGVAALRSAMFATSAVAHAMCVDSVRGTVETVESAEWANLAATHPQDASFIPVTVEPLFLRWNLGEVLEYTG